MAKWRHRSQAVAVYGNFTPDGSKLLFQLLSQLPDASVGMLKVQFVLATTYWSITVALAALFGAT